MKNASKTLVRRSIIPRERITSLWLMLSLARNLSRRDIVYSAEPADGSAIALLPIPGAFV